jgi:hypothetical protein
MLFKTSLFSFFLIRKSNEYFFFLFMYVYWKDYKMICLWSVLDLKKYPTWIKRHMLPFFWSHLKSLFWNTSLTYLWQDERMYRFVSSCDRSSSFHISKHSQGANFFAWVKFWIGVFKLIYKWTNVNEFQFSSLNTFHIEMWRVIISTGIMQKLIKKNFTVKSINDGLIWRKLNVPSTP